ncbi:hypothetical protein FHX59_002082 [Paraburkholderia silvatlantica]|uniref:Uncharacterized protein n=1 Tax=Paraburkholderia silvatlantica TaxID=321895 RepID=A0ABR6FKK6_9BURK|nr:hypothetical protein [Paraburkholderia silvatlantica]
MKRQADEREHANGQVDKKDRAPAQTERVQADERAAAKLADHGGNAEHEGIKPHHAYLLVRREYAADRGEHLRGEGRGEQALQDAPGDERRAAGGQAAERGGDDEARHARHEDAFAAV